MKKLKVIKPIKKTPKTLIKALKKYASINGFAKTAVALGYTDANAIRNWIAREEIPVNKREAVKELYSINVNVVRFAVTEL
ncbi:hypothetical protein KAU11_06210 [Candidatus Babeliales bacterium]|nr:hypothetical protein [Candidatus Babeliales bacterium]